MEVSDGDIACFDSDVWIDYFDGVPRESEQTIPVKVTGLSEYQGKKFFFDAPEVNVKLTHNERGTKPIHVSRIAVDMRKLDLSADAESQFAYSVDPLKLRGHGITKVRQYVFEFLFQPSFHH